MTAMADIFTEVVSALHRGAGQSFKTVPASAIFVSVAVFELKKK